MHQDSADLLVGVGSQKFSVNVARIWAGSELSPYTCNCKFQVTRAGGRLSPVYAKEGTRLHDIASQSNQKVTSDVHYYNYNQVITCGVDWTGKMTDVLVAAGQEFSREKEHPCKKRRGGSSWGRLRSRKSSGWLD